MADLEPSILEAEGKRCAAMIAGDATALSLILDDRLHFTHATGAVDDKVAYLAKFAAGRIDYVEIAWSEQRVLMLSDSAVVLTGRMVSTVRVEGVEKQLDNRAMAAWTHADGRWRIAAFQSTPLKS